MNLNKSELPVVVKADGLAAGKGVTICKTKTGDQNHHRNI